MNARIIRRIAGLMTVAMSTCTAQAQTYTINSVGSVGAPYSGAQAINDSGLAVGFGALADANFNGLISFGGVATPIAPFGSDSQCHAFAVSDAGAIAAVSYTLGSLQPTALLIEGATVTKIPGISPRGLNDSGMLVGSASEFNPGLGWLYRPVRWLGGTATHLNTLGGDSGTAAAVDPSGRIVGWSWTTANANVHATLWQNNGTFDLGTLPGGTKSQAYAINSAGTVVGWSTNAAGLIRPFKFSINAAGTVTTRTELGLLPGARSGHAFGINATGDVVGTSGSRATLWPAAGAVLDLNALIPPGGGWVLERAESINASGQIAGNGKLNGFPTGFVLTLVPPCQAITATDPASSSTCAGGSAAFAIAANGTAPAYMWQWRRLGQLVWLQVAPGLNTDGVASFQSVGGDASLVNVSNYSEAGSGVAGGARAEFRCVVSNACSSVTSNAATLSICIGDTDCDGDTDSDDIVAFFSAWDIGDPQGDIDGDSDADSDDIIAFFSAWDGGC